MKRFAAMALATLALSVGASLAGGTGTAEAGAVEITTDGGVTCVDVSDEAIAGIDAARQRTSVIMVAYGPVCP